MQQKPLNLKALDTTKVSTAEKMIRAKALRAAWERGMIEDVILKPPQIEMLKFIDKAEGPLFFLLCSRRIGKSTVLATLAVRECIRRPGARVLFLTDSAIHASEILSDTLPAILDTCPEDLRPVPRVKENKLVFSNGSTFTAKGIEGGSAKAIRGLKGDIVIIDEACFIENISYSVYSVLMPMVIAQRGKLICGSTPPDSPGHESVELIQDCESNNTLMRKNIYELKGHLYDDKQIALFEKQAGGKSSTRFRREYLAEVVSEDDFAICPSATPEKMSKIIAITHMPQGYDPDCYVGLDLGMRDKTVAIFAHWDYQNAKLVVQRESVFEDKKATTTNMAAAFQEMEKTLWDLEPFKRYCDLDLRFIEDIKQLHGIRFQASPKDNKEAAVNQLNIMIQNEQLVIDPSCSNLISQIQYGTWKENRKEFSRSKKLGHCDALDALIFIIRNLKKNRNPIPGSVYNNHIYVSDDQSLMDTRRLDGWESFGRTLRGK